MRPKEGSIVYPERPGEPDCTFYVRHGECGYGSRCRFNHPPASTTQLADQAGSSQRRFPERIGQPDCRYYLRTGDCKYGASCKFHHPCNRDGSSKEEVQLNSIGLPMRLVCEGPNSSLYGLCQLFLCWPLNYYASTSRVRGNACITHAPVHANLGSIANFTIHSQQMVELLLQHPILTCLRNPTPASYNPVILSPRWWLKGPIRPVTPLDRIERSPRTNTKTIHGKESVAKNSNPVPSVEEDLPEREGQPECLYFLKTGDCRFGASCKFHHPKGRTPIASPSSCPLNIIGLPLRLGEPQCNFYARFGICKFGPACKFDHPLLLPYYNALGTRPVITMALSSRDGMPGTSAANNLSAGKWKGSRDVAELTKEEEQDAGSVESSRADETGEGVEGTES